MFYHSNETFHKYQCYNKLKSHHEGLGFELE